MPRGARWSAGSVVLPEVAVGDRLPDLHHDVSATTVVLGALATRDWRPMHHDRDFAIERNGARDIFLNTPNQQAWFERFVTDWTGPLGRPGRLHFRMRDSVYPGETHDADRRRRPPPRPTPPAAAGRPWPSRCAPVERLCTTATLRIAVPTTSDDNPWRRSGDRWVP